MFVIRQIGVHEFLEVYWEFLESLARLPIVGERYATVAVVVVPTHACY